MTGRRRPALGHAGAGPAASAALTGARRLLTGARYRDGSRQQRRSGHGGRSDQDRWRCAGRRRAAAAQPRAAGRRRARRLHLGRARPPARGARASRSTAISGTSAGALNAVVLASGWLAGGAPAARRGARPRCGARSRRSRRFSPLRAGGMSQMAADFTAQLLSPYQLNPLGLNPLAPDPRAAGRLRAPARASARSRCSSPRPTCAPAEARIFRKPRADADAVLASACLPQLHQAVAIDGEVYWDGGFVSNPPLDPAGRALPRRATCCWSRSTRRPAPQLPKSARDIRNRIAEIVFGRPLAAELRAAGRAPPRAPARR